MAREPRDAAILALGDAGQALQALRPGDTLGGGEARLRVIGGERDVDQHVLVANRGDGAQPSFAVDGPAGDRGTHRVGAVVAGERGERARGIRHLGQDRAQCRRDRVAHPGVLLGARRRLERGQAAALARGRRPDLGHRIAGEQRREFRIVRRELRNAGDALGRIRVLVQRGAGEKPGDHDRAPSGGVCPWVSG